jgi:hypothetical protein
MFSYFSDADADRESRKSFFYWRAWTIQFYDRAIKFANENGFDKCGSDEQNFANRYLVVHEAD